MKKNSERPAMPLHVPDQSIANGLTKREYIATHILTGLVVKAIPGGHNTPDNLIQENVPLAVMMADALLNELEK